MGTKEHLTSHRRTLDVSSEPTLCAPRGPRLFDPRAWVEEIPLAEALARTAARSLPCPETGSQTHASGREVRRVVAPPRRGNKDLRFAGSLRGLGIRSEGRDMVA